MKRVKGTEGVSLLECINPNKNRWAVRFDMQPNVEDNGEIFGVNYWEEVFEREPTLEEVKGLVAQAIDHYDVSSEVSDFTVSGVSMWLDKGTRTGLALTITTLLNNIESSVRAAATEGVTEEQILATIAEQTATKTVRLWSLSVPPVPFDLPILTMQNMLGMLETYAKATYDQTQEHKSAEYALTTIDEVLNYNYRADYPDKIAL